MTRIVITGGPRTGKTTLANRLADENGDPTGITVAHTDDLIAQCAHLGKDAWSEGSRLASEWLNAPGPWIIEGVALARALRKWREAHPGEPPAVDKVIRLTEPHVALPKGQAAMTKGEETVWREIESWILHAGVPVEYRSALPASACQQHASHDAET
jgi:GTPase SAR1 family protein